MARKVVAAAAEAPPVAGTLSRSRSCARTSPDRGRGQAVDGVSFLDRGKTVGVVGESGSGKTILARSIMGLLPTRNIVREGQVRYEGGSTTGPTGCRASGAPRMAMVFQDPMTSLNPWSGSAARSRNRSSTTSTWTGTRPRRPPWPFSPRWGSPACPAVEGVPAALGGCVSGWSSRSAWLADRGCCSPTSPLLLDVTVQAQILDLLAEQQRERFMALVLVATWVWSRRAGEIAVMYAGKIVEEASVLFSSVRMPYTEALLVDPPAREQAAHQARGHRRPAAGPRQSAEGLQLQPPLSLRPTLLRGRAAAAGR